MKQARLGFLGFGEAGRAMAATLNRDFSLQCCAYDRAAGSSDMFRTPARQSGSRLLGGPAALAGASDIIISVVTADEAEAAALSVLPHLKPGQIFIDANSVSPGTKRAISISFAERKIDYVDMAIMAPIHPAGHKTKMLAAGPAASQLGPILRALDFQFDWRGSDVGAASVVKMLRSVLIKGVESLVCECVSAAQELGLDDEILSSAGRTLGIADMPALGAYVMERVAVHGRRRAAEMREVAKTLDEMGLSSHLPAATARHQDMVADMQLAKQMPGGVPQDREVLARLMRAYQRRK